MGVILSIETTTDVCSVALNRSNDLLSYLEVHIGKSHSEKLTLMIQQALQLADLAFSDLSAVAVSMGPGSYTGLRVGTSTAKGLCMALDIPLISINTLKAMALEISCNFKEDVLLAAMIDARRMEVYCAIFDSCLKEKLTTSALVLDESSFAKELNDHQILFFGSGSEKFKTIVKSRNALFLDNKYPQAKFIGQLANLSFQKGIFEDLHSFEPFYLKDFVLTKKNHSNG